jgi:hypothetical protein
VTRRFSRLPATVLAVTGSVLLVYGLASRNPESVVCAAVGALLLMGALAVA